MIHIHNGDVVAALARRGGIPGEHLTFRESLVTGPVVPGDEWIETRAQALAEGHVHDLLRVRTDLLEQEQALDRAASQDEVVLWFEHDLYCLVHLVYLLQRLNGAQLSLIWSPVPLAEHDEEALYELYDARAAVDPATTALAGEAWAAYTSADPAGLNRFLDRDRAELPFLRDGLMLHASRFPSTFNGLGSMEHRVLAHIAAGFTDFATLFDHVNAEVPRFGFGDSEVFRHLRALASRNVPLITLNGELPKAIANITQAGERVLAGTDDDTAINETDLWLGGAHVTRQRLFRWNGEWIEG